ncbi:SDR family oxidoreductase [Pseudonocardia xishanensis]|uniref:SDR family NAD(P)-dependent oxidoreductase n=1 Tax=Pseudonocardia xishanensis TaxID=630995 RepID=A0ABP8S2M9_9PSEU
MNPVCLITGAAGGIGAATARLLASRGARLVVADRDAEGLAAVAAELSPRTEVLARIIDLTVEAEVDALVEAAVTTFGGLDQVSLTAGMESPHGTLEELSLADYERVMAVNATSAFLCLKAVLPHMKRAGRGSIVSTASIAGLAAVPGQGVYSAAKHAMIGLTRAAAVEAGAFGVRVNAVLPGPIDTGMVTRIRAGSASTPVGGGTLLGRMGTPAEAAAVIAFLLSDGAAFVTNSYWTADGGRHQI